MVLCADIGNTDTDLAVYSDGEKRVSVSLATPRDGTEADLAVRLDGVMRLYGVNPGEIDGGIAASVVPDMTDVFVGAIKKLCGFDMIVLGPGIKSGVDIKTDYPHEVGADIIANCARALCLCGAPCVITDFETATTVVYIDENKRLSDVFILPGLFSSYGALISGTAKLPEVRLRAPRALSGKNSDDSINCGVVYAAAYSADGFMNSLKKRSERPTSLLATGEAARLVLPVCRNSVRFEESLTCDGLYDIFLRNSTL